jgi:2'-5' RNA ligase
MIRLFVAVELPETVRDRLLTLEGGVPGARWVNEDQMHLTLRFIGEVDDNVANDVDDALSGIRAPGFELELSGVGEFGGKNPRALWAGVRPNPALLHLQKKLQKKKSQQNNLVDKCLKAPLHTIWRGAFF